MSPLLRTTELARAMLRPRIAQPVAHGEPGVAQWDVTTWARHGGWRSCAVHSLADAGDLCDLLDMHGISDRTFQIVDNDTFVVAWR